MIPHFYLPPLHPVPFTVRKETPVSSSFPYGLPPVLPPHPISSPTPIANHATYPWPPRGRQRSPCPLQALARSNPCTPPPGVLRGPVEWSASRLPEPGVSPICRKEPRGECLLSSSENSASTPALASIQSGWAFILAWEAPAVKVQHCSRAYPWLVASFV